MALYNFNSPVSWVPFEQSSEQKLGLWAEVLRHPEFGLQDLVHRLLPVLALERQLTGQHLVHQDAEAPPVGAEAVPLPVDHLGGHVLDGAAERVRLVFQGLLGKAKVGDGDVSAGVLKNKKPRRL